MIISLNSCNSIANKSATRLKTQKRVPATTEITINYPEIFKASREILKQDLMTPTHIVKKDFKNLPESLLIENLQVQERELPEAISTTILQHEALIELLKKESSQKVDPSKHLRLIPPKGTSGYSDLQFYSSHPYSYIPEGQTKSKNIPQSNLVEIWKSFIAKAEKQIVLNVYDFDLETIAETLIKKGQKGLQVRVGIDKNVIANRPEVKKIFDLLNKSGVIQVTAVDSVGLNHQKMTAIDWDYPNMARVLFSSGNLTQSCLDPEGDIKNIKPHPDDAIPNANHLITMKSWLLANLVNHELSKTLDPDLQLRGAQYPLTGAYQVTGPEVKDPENLFSEPRPLHSLIISFTPGGGYKDVNANLIARLISENNGPLRLIQFAFSSSEVGDAIFAKAHQAYINKKNFDFLSVGDTPFSLQKWSQFLKLSGLKVLKNKGQKNKYFSEDSESPSSKLLSPEQLQDLRSKIFIGPKNYRTHSINLPDGSSQRISAKIHHKILAIGDFAIVGTSFNFSKNAQSNNEQILIFREPDLARRVNGMTQWLAISSGKTVYQEALRRNNYNEPPSEENESEAP